MRKEGEKKRDRNMKLKIKEETKKKHTRKQTNKTGTMDGRHEDTQTYSSGLELFKRCMKQETCEERVWAVDIVVIDEDL